MRHEQVDVARPEAVAVEQPAGDLFRFPHGELEHRLPVLLHVVQAPIDRLVRRGHAAAAGGHAERRAAAPVDLVLEVENHPFAVAGGGDDDRARAVAEQHAGRSILVVDDARHHIGADHQRVIVGAAGDELAGGGQRVGERRAGGAQIEAPRAARADLFLDEAGGAWKEHVRRHGADDNEADVVRREPGLGDRLDGGFGPEIRSRDAVLDDVALADAGPLQDPVVARVDHLLQIGVGEQPRRHERRQRSDRRRPSSGARLGPWRVPRACRMGYHNRESLRCSTGAISPK